MKNITKERNEKHQELQSLSTQLQSLQKDLAQLSSTLRTEQDTHQKTNDKNRTLAQEIQILNDRLKNINDLLNETQRVISEKDDLLMKTKKDLNKILTEKIEELEKAKNDYDHLKCAHDLVNKKNQEQDAQMGQFRSEFFDELQKIVGNHQDIRIVGDRFVFQSEVLFSQGSANLEEEGTKQLDLLIKTLKELSKKIPSSIPWILRIDGHTDKVPIKTQEFPSNWELSCSRAIAVVRYMVSKGLSPSHLVAAGFGEFQPITKVKEELSKNRRIEFKLDRR